ncbi:hypothetical protein FISHEDRAFT_27981, partial [Fistulina hepatica ATCC 64428]
LKREKLYLSPKKLKFLLLEHPALECIVVNDGICLDPVSINNILKWPIPTNKKLLKGF